MEKKALREIQGNHKNRKWCYKKCLAYRSYLSTSHTSLSLFLISSCCFSFHFLFQCRFVSSFNRSFVYTCSLLFLLLRDCLKQNGVNVHVCHHELIREKLNHYMFLQILKKFMVTNPLKFIVNHYLEYFSVPWVKEWFLYFFVTQQMHSS